MFLEDLPDMGIMLSLEILLQPVSAFRSAQVWESSNRDGLECFHKHFRLLFANNLFGMTSLSTAHDPRINGPNAQSLRALDSYLGVFARLLTQWRVAGQDPLRWWTDKDNQEDVRRLQNAQINTSTELCLGYGSRNQTMMPPWMVEEPRPNRRARRSELIAAMEKVGARLEARVLRGIPLLRHQRSLRHAASTAAYRLFAEVLVRELKVSFCVRCDAIFACGKKTKFCSTRCAHSDSGLQSKNNRTRKQNRERVSEASKTLSRWIQRPHKHWRDKVESALFARQLKENPLRKSQWLGRCIRASESPKDSPLRVRLIELCTERGAPEGESRKVSEDFASLFPLIQQAETLEKDNRG